MFFVLVVLPAIPPLETTTVPATVPSLPCRPRPGPVGVIVFLAVFAVCSLLLSVVLLSIAIVIYRKKASRWNRKIATSVMSPETTKHSINNKPQVKDAELLDLEAHDTATPDAVTENKEHGSTNDLVYHKRGSRWNRKIATSVMSPETTKNKPQVKDAELLDQKGEADGAATPDAGTENKAKDQKGEADGAATPNAETENEAHGSTNDQVYHKKASRWNRKIATSVMSPETTKHSKFNTKSDPELLDQKGEAHGAEDLSATSSVQSKHSFHSRLWVDSFANLDEPEIRCEHSFCRDDYHDHDIVTMTKSPTALEKSYDSTGRTRGGSAEMNQASENQPTKGIASPLAKMDTTDRSILESNKNVQGICMSAKVHSSPDIVAKRRSMAGELAKNSDSIALGQVRSSPTVIILEDQERSNLVSKQDTSIQDEGYAEPSKRRPRARTVDDSDGIAGQDSSPRITHVFSLGRSELNTLVKRGSYSTTDVQDQLKDEAHGMLGEGSMFEERPPEDQSESYIKFDGSISEGDFLRPPSCGFSRIAFSEVVQTEGTDSHSSRARPYRSMTDVRPSLELGSTVYSKSENELPRLEKGRLLAWLRPESANYPRAVEKVSVATSEEGEIKKILSLS